MGNKAVRHDSQSHCFYGGEKLAIEWLPDGEVLIVDPQTWDPDLAFVLAWWQRESCWYDDASIVRSVGLRGSERSPASKSPSGTRELPGFRNR